MFHFKKDHPGIVTVFVTLILMPTIAFTGIMSDLARFKTAQQTVSDANQLYASSVLAQYDSVLKEMYGLFALSQDESATSGFENYAYAVIDPSTSIYNGVPNQDAFDLVNRIQQLFDSDSNNLLNPYKKMTVSASYKKVGTSSLATSTVLQNQVGDYMKYRVATQLMDIDILGAVEALENLAEGSKVLEKKTEIDEMIEDLDKLYKKLYSQMTTNEGVPKMSMASVGNSLKNNYANEIITLQGEINALQDEIEALKNSDDKDAKDKIKEKEDKINELDEAAKGTAQTADNYINSVKSSYPSSYESNAKNIQSTCNSISKKVKDIQSKVKEMESQLSSCSPAVQDSMREQIKEYSALFGTGGEFDFTSVGNYYAANDGKLDTLKKNIDKVKLYDQKSSSEKSFSNIAFWGIKDKNITSIVGLPIPELNWNYASGNAGAKKLYEALQGYCATTTDSSAKKTASSNRDALSERTNSLIKNVFGTPDLVVSTIPDGIWNARSYGGSGTTSGKTPSVESGSEGDMAKTITGDISDQFNGASAGNGTDLLHKLLMVAYDTGMFTCYSTNVQHEKDPDNNPVELTMTGMEKSPDLNYIYRSELEYIFAGSQSCTGNVSTVRTTIYGIRYVLNFIYTYTDSEINNGLTAVATLLAGGNPLLQIVIREALRAALTGLETANDLNELLNGESVALYKQKSDWVYKPSQIFGSVASSSNTSVSNKPTTNFTLSYEGYVTLLLLLFKDGETLTARTGNLIEMNVNHYRQAPLTSLDYKLTSSYTAIQTSIDSALPMTFMPFVQNVFGKDGTTFENPFSDTFTYTETRGY